MVENKQYINTDEEILLSVMYKFNLKKEDSGWWFYTSPNGFITWRFKSGDLNVYNANSKMALPTDDISYYLEIAEDLVDFHHLKTQFERISIEEYLEKNNLKEDCK